MSNPVNVLQALREFLVEQVAECTVPVEGNEQTAKGRRAKLGKEIALANRGAAFQAVMEKLDELESPDYTKPHWQNYEGMRALQAMLYVTCGCGMVGTSNAGEPKGNYVDTRVPLKRTESQQRKQIARIRNALVKTAEAIGYNPVQLPGLPNFHQVESDVE